MNFLEERIAKDGVVKEGNVLKVDSFLNHQMDIELFDEMGAEFKRRFANENINKILTIEASGICLLYTSSPESALSTASTVSAVTLQRLMDPFPTGENWCFW